MASMIRCILYPGAKLFVCSGGKEQSAGIIQEKVTEICNLIPAFERELDMRPKKTIITKDYCKYVFKNGSYFDVVAASEKSRGKRRHGGVMEECVGIDGEILNEVILPIMNVSRTCADGVTRPKEVLNKSQIYITTAGYKSSFSYDKLIQILIWSLVSPKNAIVLGGSYRIPVLMGLLDAGFIRDLKMDGTFNEASFGREYESTWSGTVENAFFNGEVFDRNRILNQPEYEYSARSNKQAYYILGVDVGRKGCQTVITIVKVTPQPSGLSMKTLVNLYTLEDDHFEDQAIAIKKLFYKYKARTIVLDANGLGIGLLDYMVKTQIDPNTGDTLYDFGVENDPDGYYKKYRTPNTEFDAIYALKANAAINTAAHANFQTQLTSGKVKFLIDERIAKTKLLGTKKGQDMTPEKRADYLRPFTLTSILKEEIMNLKEENEGTNIILKQDNKRIGKDKFSSLEYALYYIRELEESKKKKKKFRISDYMFIN